jgi:predicted nuclease with TOPRIM domain
MGSILAAAFDSVAQTVKEEAFDKIEKLEEENKNLREQFEKVKIENKFLNERIKELEEDIEQMFLEQAGESR